MRNIAIIGAGQLGSRHLQSLAALAKPHEIFIVDPSKESINLAKNRWAEINPPETLETFFIHTQLELPKMIDLAIVASSSAHRPEIIQNLIKNHKVEYLILEKFLFQTEDDYNSIENLLDCENVPTWVNCPRRLYPVYKSLKSNLIPHQPIAVEISGGNWGMACNTIHFLDLLSYLTDEYSTLKLMDADLLEGLEKSKRPGYIEVFGKLCFHDEKGNTLIATCTNDSSNQLIKIHQNSRNFMINESDNNMTEYFSDSKYSKTTIKTPFQSELTYLVVENIFQNGTCELCTLKNSSLLHIQILKPLLSHYNKSVGLPNNKVCPIT